MIVPPEPGIDPAAGLVERDPEPGNAGLSFDRGNDVVGEADTFQGLGEDELPRVEDEEIRMGFFNFGCNALPVVGIDDLFSRFVPDKMVPEAYIQRVRLDEPGVVRIDFDMTPPDAIEYLPVNKNHGNSMRGHPSLALLTAQSDLVLI